MPAKPSPVNAARHARVSCETRTALNTPIEDPVHEIPPWRRAAVWPLAALVRLWATSIRVRIPPEDQRALDALAGPVVFALWHNRLFMAAAMQRRIRPGRRLYSLISASRDGAWLAAFFDACGIGAVRGSSSRLAREAVRELLDAVGAGIDVGITPDGPRGPRYEVKPGALVVARRAAVPVVLVGIDFESSWRLASWDGFYLPVPFSRAHARMVRFEAGGRDSRDEGALELGAALAAINPDRRPAPVRTRA